MSPLYQLETLPRGFLGGVRGDGLADEPSEAEWEYAARGGTTMRYAFGNAITLKDANYSESKLGKTTKVGSYLSNAWGLYDMHGNAWEWVEDVWHSSYEGASTDGTAWIRQRGRKFL
jgi:formylglycine-generating enzyme required for sulfatase activity